MKFFASVFFITTLSLGFIQSQAQQKHFIYIESENNQPFALVMNGKVYSSSDFGYVIVPKLDDGTYNFTISFPLNKYPDQNFKCVVDKKDVGYKLKNNGDKTWALQNMQSDATNTNTTAASTATNTTTASPSNAFGNMLSDVVNDSTLTKKTVPAKQADTVAAAPSKIDTPTVTLSTIDTTNNNAALVTDSVNTLQKISETKQDTGTNMVFVDKTSGADTINVFVPSSDSLNNTSAITTTNNPVTQQQINNADTSTKSVVSDNTATNVTSSSSETVDTSLHAVGNPFYKSNNQDNASANPTAVSSTNANNTAENTTVAKTTSAIRNDCAVMISDNDLDKVKRKMFVQSNDNSMVQTAIKYLGKKCITTDQVKTLGSIFSSDDGRYNLYDALYKQTYDYGNYANLESQIIDPYYKRRFETMLR